LCESYEDEQADFNSIVLDCDTIVREFNIFALYGTGTVNNTATQGRSGSAAKTPKPQTQKPSSGKPILFSFADIMEKVRSCYVFA